MTNFETAIDAVLKPVIAMLESAEPLAYSDHETFFVDLGWDVQSGDGRLCDLAEGMLRVEFDNLPLVIKSWLWWKTSDGKVEERYIESALEVNPPDYSGLEEGGYEIFETVMDELKKRLFELAEIAYDEYQEENF